MEAPTPDNQPEPQPKHRLKVPIEERPGEDVVIHTDGRWLDREACKYQAPGIFDTILESSMDSVMGRAVQERDNGTTAVSAFLANSGYDTRFIQSRLKLIGWQPPASDVAKKV